MRYPITAAVGPWSQCLRGLCRLLQTLRRSGYRPDEFDLPPYTIPQPLGVPNGKLDRAVLLNFPPSRRAMHRLETGT